MIWRWKRWIWTLNRLETLERGRELARVLHRGAVAVDEQDFRAGVRQRLRERRPEAPRADDADSLHYCSSSIFLASRTRPWEYGCSGPEKNFAGSSAVSTTRPSFITASFVLLEFLLQQLVLHHLRHLDLNQ